MPVSVSSVLTRVLSAVSLTRVRSSHTCKKTLFYAVARGHEPGIYKTWEECQKSINGYSGARYKKFETENEAKEFIVSQEHITKDSNHKKDKEAHNDYGAREDQLGSTLENMSGSMRIIQRDISELKTRFEQHATIRGDVCATNSPLTNDSQEKRSEGERVRLGYHMDTGALDEDGYLIVYTDGACLMNGKLGAKAGMGVYFGPRHPLNVSEPIRGRATNNNAEIQAATCALELAHSAGFDKVAIHTDSKFMIDCASTWMENWKKRGWVKSDGEQVKNKEELVHLDKVMQGLDVKWVHIKGHTGNEGNEEADKLAGQGAKRYTTID